MPQKIKRFQIKNIPPEIFIKIFNLSENKYKLRVLSKEYFFILNKEVRYLNVKEITNSHINDFSYFINKFQNLKSLDLSGNQLGDPSVKELASSLIQKFITALNLNFKQVYHQGVKGLAQALTQNKSLTSLNLRFNRISALGMKDIAQALSHNRSLISIHLCANPIGDQGVQWLAQALSYNESLTLLDLMNNQIGNQGAQEIARTLTNNKTLTALYLVNNEIGDQGAQWLAQALTQNKSLTALDLKRNPIGDNAILGSIDNLLTRNKNVF
ncbi:MAG: hypothetical protein K2X39_03425 [Silvanigrellaceae bacterium]|nr:hypothetical protein [Silvanigrellaceae bacterium]